MYIPNLINIGSVIQKFIGDTQTYRQDGDIISLILFFQNKESRQKFLRSSSYIIHGVCV
jgi:hypothetical protein